MSHTGSPTASEIEIAHIVEADLEGQKIKEDVAKAQRKLTTLSREQLLRLAKRHALYRHFEDAEIIELLCQRVERRKMISWYAMRTPEKTRLKRARKGKGKEIEKAADPGKGRADGKDKDKGKGKKYVSSLSRLLRSSSHSSSRRGVASHSRLRSKSESESKTRQRLREEYYQRQRAVLDAPHPSRVAGPSRLPADAHEHGSAKASGKGKGKSKADVTETYTVRRGREPPIVLPIGYNPYSTDDNEGSEMSRGDTRECDDGDGPMDPDDDPDDPHARREPERIDLREQLRSILKTAHDSLARAKVQRRRAASLHEEARKAEYELYIARVRRGQMQQAFVFRNWDGVAPMVSIEELKEGTEPEGKMKGYRYGERDWAYGEWKRGVRDERRARMRREAEVEGKEFDEDEAGEMEEDTDEEEWFRKERMAVQSGEFARDPDEDYLFEAQELEDKEATADRDQGNPSTSQ